METCYRRSCCKQAVAWGPVVYPFTPDQPPLNLVNTVVFDDSSSISSGEISDTIAEISTDENLTGSSQGALSDQNPYNPYSSLKRGPHSLHAGYLNPNGGGGGGGGGIAAGVIPPGYILAGGSSGVHQGYPHHPLHNQQVGGYKRVPNLGTSAFMGTDYNSDSGIGSGVGPGQGGSPWGRKYSLPQAGSKFSALSNDPNKLLSSDPSDYGYGYGWPSSRSDSGGVYSSLRKMSSGSNPDYAYHSEGDYDAPGPPAGNMHRRSFSPLPPPGGIKRDTETNTDQSHLLEASMRRLQTSASSGSGLGRNGGCGSNPPASNGAGTQFGYRRSLSNASRDSLGSPTKGTSSSSSSNKNSPGSSAVGSRLAKHGIEAINQQMMMMPPRPASAAGRPMMHPDMMIEGGSGYHTSPSSATSTLERKRKNGNGGGSLTSSKSTGCTQTQTPALPERGVEYQSNSLGRRRLFASGSKHALCKSSSQDAGGCPSGVPGSPSSVGGTIISNPHATYGRSAVEQHHQQLLQQQATSHYVNMQELHARANYVSLDFPPSPRNSGLVAAGGPGIHGSNLSLVSSTSSVYSSIRKLKRDLMLAQEKVQNLTCQLSNNVSRPVNNSVYFVQATRVYQAQVRIGNKLRYQHF
ncbi:neuron navigator 2 [Elysia marginata]|uniref:Neuron navigator 2 n=1 Tax=Elysia marginata TaxID=1093978 RepID=A0AAV4K1C6_9GAST|nr:neuron navigator 2 [Elysia marginata]